jgi:hypothetical protein
MTSSPMCNVGFVAVVTAVVKACQAAYPGFDAERFRKAVYEGAKGVRARDIRALGSVIDVHRRQDTIVLTVIVVDDQMTPFKASVLLSRKMGLKIVRKREAISHRVRSIAAKQSAKARKTRRRDAEQWMNKLEREGQR